MWSKVDSSAIARVNYDAAQKKLLVQFHGKTAGSLGPVAEYDNVSEDTNKKLMSADSKGSFFHRHIRNAEKHPWRYVSEKNHHEKTQH